MPVAEVRAVQHEVVHQATGRRLGYGELAADAAEMPVPKANVLRLKSPAEFRYIGKEQVRPVDLEAIGKGRATYGMDMRLPGMVYAVVARPPVVGGTLRRVDSAKALAVPGVLKVVEIPASGRARLSAAGRRSGGCTKHMVGHAGTRRSGDRMG